MKKEFNFIQSRKICVIISLCIFAVGILFNVIFGTGMDVSFSGGTLVRYSYAEKIDVNAVQAMAQDVLGKDAEASLENVDNTDVVTVTFPKEITLEQQTKLNERMTKDFKDNKPVQVEAKTLSAPMGRQFFVKCLAAIALAAGFLLLYVGLRFRRIGGFSAGLCALLALVHDLLICYFVFVIFRINLDDNFVAVMLTILGYSLNDTIVIFDRVRENRRRHKNMPISDVVNLSINQTFTRTLVTAVAVFVAIAVVVVVALIMRIDSIMSFALPMMFGVVSGFYSSVFLSAPIWALWREKKAEKK
ncbi:MAG: protein translocase subunit SecF [Ruminococcaceae bacterium]|nr:protein translocase subunit SecF [Oscillospiraceae bacterium]